MTLKHSLDPDMIPVYRDLSVVVAFRESCVGGIDATIHEIDYFETLALRVQHQLIAFYSTHISRQDSDIQSICRVTATIFVIQSQPRNYGPSIIMDNMVLSLYDVLSGLDFAEAWNSFPSILIWALMFGVWISREKSMRDWFLFKLAQGSHGQLRWQWNEIRDMLQKLFYVDRLHGADFESIWEEVRLLVPHAGRA